MADQVIDVITIEIKGDTADAGKSIDNLIGTLGKLGKAVSGCNQSFSAIKNHLAALNNIASNFGGSGIDNVKKLAEGLKPLEKIGKISIPKSLPDRILNLGAAVDSLKGVDFSKLDEMAAGLGALSAVGNVNIPKITFPVSDVAAAGALSSLTGETTIPAGTDIEETTDKLKMLGAELGKTAAKTKDVKGKVDKQASSWEGLKVKATEALAKIVVKLKELSKKLLMLPLKPITWFAKKVQSAVKRLGEFLKALKRIAMYRFIRMVLREISQGFREGTDNLYQYSKAFNGVFAQSMDSISTSLLYLKNSIGAVVAPLINALAPAIDFVIDKLVDLLNMFNEVAARITGASTWTKAIRYPKEYADAADGANGAMKELRKTILGIDELNLMTDNSAHGHGSGGAGENYSLMFEEMPVEDAFDFGETLAGVFKIFKDAWDSEGSTTINDIKIGFGDIKELLETIRKTFRTVFENGEGQEVLRDILKLLGSIVKVAGSLARALSKAWKENEVGERIMNNLLGIVDKLLKFMIRIYESTDKFLSNTDFGPLLKSVEGLTSAFEPLVDLLGGTLADIYETVLLPIAGWVIEDAAPTSVDVLTEAVNLLTAVLSPLLEGLQILFKALKPIIKWVEKVVMKVLRGVKDLFKKLSGVFEEKRDVIVKVFEKIGNALELFWEIGEPIFNIISDTVGNVFTFVGHIVESVVGGLLDKLNGFIDFLEGVFTGDWDKVWEGITEMFKADFDIVVGVLGSIAEFFKNTWDSIKENAKLAWDKISGFFTDKWESIKEDATKIWENIKKVFKDSFQGITDFFKNVFKGDWEGAWKGIKDATVPIINGIISAFEGMVNFVIKGLNSMIKALNKLHFEIPDWVPIIGGKSFGFNIALIKEVTLPRLAGGGILDAGQMFIARESGAGAELVGKFGNQTGVMNNEQIVDSVSQGVADANAEQNILLREQNELLRKLLDKETLVRAIVDTDDVITGLARKNRRDGKTVIPVGI